MYLKCHLVVNSRCPQRKEQQTSRGFIKWDSWSGCIWTADQVFLWYLKAFHISYSPQTHLHLMVLGSQAGVCVCVCIHLPSQRRKTRIRGGGESEEALSLSVRLFLTAAISLIRLWRNRNLALHRPSLPLTLSHSLTPPMLSLSLLHLFVCLSICLSVPVYLSISTFSSRCQREAKQWRKQKGQAWEKEPERWEELTFN